MLVTPLPMPRQDHEEEDAAPPEPCFSTPTKADHNDGACHADPDAKRTNAKSDADVEKKFYESTACSHERLFRHMVAMVATRFIV